MVQQTELLLLGRVSWDVLDGLVFCGTWCLYAIHRAVGIDRLHQFIKEERYEVIYTYRKHIWVYAVLGAIGSIFFLFQLQWETILSLIIPGILSLGYVLPLLGKGRRLRDIHWVKIFLIAIVWAWVTVLLPALELGYPIGSYVWILFLERVLFIFAITLPFDIRDLKVDQYSAVRTLPEVLGIKWSKILAVGSLVVCAVLNAIAFQFAWFALPTWLFLLISYVLISIIVLFSSPKRHDYFYTGLVDGTMLIQFGCVYFASKLG